MKRILLLITLMTPVISKVYGQTLFNEQSGIYGKMLSDLKLNMVGNGYKVVNIEGKDRTIFVSWIRDHIHTMKAHKYWAKDLSSFLEFMMSHQSSNGMYYDYASSYKDRNVSEMYFANIIDKQFFNIDVKLQTFFFRMPIEADLEYLLVEGVYTYFQSSRDTTFLRRWMPTLLKGIKYSMSDPLRWSSKNMLVKRPYSIDTWDYTSEPKNLKGVEGLLIHIGNNEKTPKGIMHGDNTGMYQACKQLSVMYAAIGNSVESREWEIQSTLFRSRINRLCWNGKYYAHFIPEEPVPDNIKTDPINTLGLSNTYSINRGTPTQEMAASIIRSYQETEEKTKPFSLASWFGIYPFIEPDFGGSKVGVYMNGAILPLVGGELTKAAFQNGFETFAVVQLKKLDELMTINKRKLPGCLNYDGTPQQDAIPSVWGQAAFVSALVEGLAGVVDKSQQFNDVEISPRWIFAGIDKTTVEVGYGGDRNQVKYQYSFNETDRQIELITSGKFNSFIARIPVPSIYKEVSAIVNGQKTLVTIDIVNESRYAVVTGKQSNNTILLKFK